MEEKVVFRGFLIKENGEYNLLAGIAGGLEFDQKQTVCVELDEISDEDFNKLLTHPKKIQILINDKPIKISISGRILGGSDPTRPLRSSGAKIKPQQKLTILLDQVLDNGTYGAVSKERVKLIVDA